MLEVRYIFDVDQKSVNEYTIKKGKYQLSVINLGATITKLIVPNEFDKLENITLRYHDYKFYKENKYLLGCLINVDQFKKQASCILNYYFDCTFLHNTLIFTYKKNEDYIEIKYTLLDNHVMIDYDTNLDMNLSHSIFFNLSGNVKENILNHKIQIDQNIIDFDQDIHHFNKFTNENMGPLLTLFHKENKITMTVNTVNRDIYMSFGKNFNEAFYVNKKNLATCFTGLGLIVCGNTYNQAVCYTFLE